MSTNQADNNFNDLLSPLEVDAIGEVMNISMGAAATAISQMLDKQVEITTPIVQVQEMQSVKYEQFEPALLVKIIYTKGITGSNVMVFRQHDMQMILNTLMGIPDPPSDDFVFDELSISAACEVMNQMMGASSTALAEFLNKTIDISTPTAKVMGDTTFIESMGIPPEELVATITFRLHIKDMVDSEFISVMTIDLVKEILSMFITNEGDVQPIQQPSQPSAVASEVAPSYAQPQGNVDAAAAAASAAVAGQPSPAAAPVMQPQAVPVAQPQQPQYQQPAAYPDMGQQAYPMPQYAPAAPMPVMQQAPMMGYAPPPPMPNIDARPVEFPEFGAAQMGGAPPVMGNNLDLIMNVPLEVAIEIGTTKKKIRDIMNFASGTVVELDKQAGAPVDIVVNGQLIAHGDVVVIDDNFGVRITEIVGTKELLNTLNGQQGGQGG